MGIEARAVPCVWTALENQVPAPISRQRERRKARRAAKARLKDSYSHLEASVNFPGQKKAKRRPEPAQKSGNFGQGPLLRELLSRCRDRRHRAALLAEILAESGVRSGSRDGKADEGFFWQAHATFFWGQAHAADQGAWQGMRAAGTAAQAPPPPDSRWFSGHTLQQELHLLGFSPPLYLTHAQVKAAFLTLARRWHPDRHPAPAQAAAAGRFKDARAAYERLRAMFPATG